MPKKTSAPTSLVTATSNGAVQDELKFQKRKPTKNVCFGCGKDNPYGLGLKFRYDEKNRRFQSRFRLAVRFTGPPGHAHGGIIAAILDEAMSKLNKVRQVLALTAKMDVRYLRPVPLGKPLMAESHEIRVRGRKHTYAAEIRTPEGRVLASSRGIFIAVDPDRLFNKTSGKSR